MLLQVCAEYPVSNAPQIWLDAKRSNKAWMMKILVRPLVRFPNGINSNSYF